jgi:hypothetical protein
MKKERKYQKPPELFRKNPYYTMHGFLGVHAVNGIHLNFVGNCQ